MSKLIIITKIRILIITTAFIVIIITITIIISCYSDPGHTHAEDANFIPSAAVAAERA